MARIHVNGTDFEYFEDGRGEPVVLVHGSASDYRTSQSQRAALARRYRAIVYSRRYHWPNKPIAEGQDYSMVAQVDDLQEILCSLDAAPAHLVGHSYGAFLSLILAIREPHLILDDIRCHLQERRHYPWE
jgi:pimeloyl-ACP methyl ester carboxylesterase